jgi:hypothetical protein
MTESYGVAPCTPATASAVALRLQTTTKRDNQNILLQTEMDIA